VLHDLRPLLAQLDPSLRQLTPILDFLGLYKRELTAFFANTVAATQAKDPGSTLHYLRTMNPLNMENLAVYPRRLGTNRTNAYTKPGNFTKLAKGLPSFETRHCNRAVPGITNTAPTGVTNTLPAPLPSLPTDQLTQQLQALIPQPLLDNLNKFVLSQATNSQTAAPPCYSQGPYTVSGETTQYPHVKAK
jgi:phospholipid/cholesterol/gamma-HCH transport system substrate-binding protein